MKVNFTSNQLVQTKAVNNNSHKQSFTSGESTQAATSEKKPSFFYNIKQGFRSTLAMYANASEMTKGVVAGTGFGVASGAGIMALDWIVTGTSRVAKGQLKLGSMLAQPFKLAGDMIGGFFSKLAKLPHKTFKDFGLYVLKTPIRLFNGVKEAKNISKMGKIIAPAVGLFVAGWTITSARLKANQKTADLDHKFRTGHRADK